MSGLKQAALYSLRPHELGLCGPKEALQQQILRKFLQGKVSSAKVRKILQRFQGAYPYYTLIAKSNEIKDPFDKRVVWAYWLGNGLLDSVKIEDLRQTIIQDFSGPGLLSKKIALIKTRNIPPNSKPHHSFHVLVIGSVTGSVNFKNTKLKDFCRISWGKVLQKSKIPCLPAGRKNQKSKIIVKYQPLVQNKKIIKLGKLIKKEIIWDKEMAPKVRRGEWVSFHWNCLVQILSKDEVMNLKRYTINTLNSLNRL